MINIKSCDKREDTLMKNAFYTIVREESLHYLKDRNATFTPIVKLDQNVKRKSVRNEYIRYDSILRGIVPNPIPYRINILVKKNHPDTIRILLPAREYVVRLQYADSDVICSFPFEFDQVTFRKELYLDKYVDNFDAVDQMMDNAIMQQIEKDIQKIFQGLIASTPLPKSKESWVIKSKETPEVRFKPRLCFE